MKKAGIISGTPAAALSYYSGIVEGYRAAKGDGSYPAFTLENIDMAEAFAFVAQEKWTPLVSMLLAAVRSLKNAGAEFAAIASNTPHIVFRELEEKSPLPLVSIVESVCRFAADAGCARVIILGTGLHDGKRALYGSIPALWHRSADPGPGGPGVCTQYDFFQIGGWDRPPCG